MAGSMRGINSEPKRKNDDKPKGAPHRRALFAGFIFSLMLFPVAVFILESRFTPMSDVPNDDLIYMVGEQGYTLDFQTGQRTLTTIPIDLNSGLFDWNETSPDGRWQASFDWDELSVKASLRLRDFTGEEPERLLGTFGGFYSLNNLMSWSADQQWLAFSAYTHDPDAEPNTSVQRSEIWITNITTAASQQLTTNTYMDAEPVFSPDGAQIAYTSSADGTSRVYILDIATRETRLFTPDQYATNPRWSPDGQWIAYYFWHKNEEIDPQNIYIDLYIMRVDGMHRQAVMNGGVGAPIIGWES